MGFNNYMKILQTNNYQTTNFKSTFPVVHWVAEAGGSYAPVGEKAVVEDFQQKILNFLRKSIKETLTEVKKLEDKMNKKNIGEEELRGIKRKLKSLYEILDVPAQKFRTYIASVDVDYRLCPKRRSYYNAYYGSTDCFSPTSYIITGHNVADFDEKFGKELGKQKRIKKTLLEKGVPSEEAETPEYRAALYKYNHDGFDYVNYYPRRIKDGQGKTQTLHTKFEIERDDSGKFIGYRFVDARFKAEYGPDSPMEKLKEYFKK